MATAPLAPFDVPLAGTVLVEASAGTGKTHAITSLFLRLVLEGGMPIEAILVVTFTEAATAELRDRVRGRLRVALDALSGTSSPNDPELAAFITKHTDQRAVFRERAATALRDLDLAAISTIHAFCMRMLQEHAFESGARFGLTLMPDVAPLVHEVAHDYWAARVYELDEPMYELATSKFKLDVARNIVKTFASRPTDLPVLPAKASTVEAVAALRATADSAFDGARALWLKDAKRITDLVSKAGLKANSYKPEDFPGWWADLDGYFATAEPTYVAPGALEKLTRRCLEKGTKVNKTTPSHPFFDAANALDQALDELHGGFVIDGLRRGAVDWVRTELPRRKESLRAQSFDDLLNALDVALRGGARADALRKRINGRFRAALIDEFQDTDPVQYRIFHTLFDESALLLVGDPKQSIYAFRGADVFSYMASVDRAVARYTLAENRRSDPSLVEAVNTVFARAREPFFFDRIGFHPVVAHAKSDRIDVPGSSKAALEILFVERAPGESVVSPEPLPERVAHEIARLLASGATIKGQPVVAGDIAVLTRFNKTARRIQAELRQLKIPTALRGDESVFESDEAHDVELLLRAMLEPTRAGTVRAALSTAVAGLSAEQLVALGSDEMEWDRRSQAFRSWLLHWTEHGFIHAYRRMLTELRAEERLLALVDGERRMTNLLHLGELLHAAATRERLAPSALVHWLGLMRADKEAIRELGSEASELRLESDAHAVKLLTIHKSKGLEYPIVYCPAFWEQRLPTAGDDAIAFHDPADDVLKIDVNPQKDTPPLTAAIRESRAEDQRLLYVALTRAKHRCIVLWGRSRRCETTALAYTIHQPASSTGELPLEVAKRLKDVTDAELRADLGRLVAASNGTIAVRTLDDTPATKYVGEAASTNELSARVFGRKKIDTWFRIGSFTALASGARTMSLLQVQGVDHDEADEANAIVPTASIDTTAEEPVILHAFPRGAKAGTMLHSLLEDYDFTTGDDTILPALAATKLTGAGYVKEEWSDVLVRGVKAMLDTPLDASGVTLAGISRSKRIDELEFVFPVAREKGLLTAASLAKAFAAHGSAQVPKGYAERVGSLGFLPLKGFLKGYIDLVFEHDGRFYVVDYKSNHLGAAPSDYTRPHLDHAMTHHDYVLQYHLYVLAVHRWLGKRLRGYDYERHFGGVFYVFARGMSPAHPPHAGVFQDRPSRAMIDALAEATLG